MTDLQKEQIKTLRLQGIGYVKIGEMLGISDNTVRSFCRRNGLGDAAKNTVACKHCGKLIKIIPKQKPRKFCSDSCRTAWWNSHPDCVDRKAVYEYACAHCGKPFTAYGNKDRKYCSHGCYISDRFGEERGCCVLSFALQSYSRSTDAHFDNEIKSDDIIISVKDYFYMVQQTIGFSITAEIMQLQKEIQCCSILGEINPRLESKVFVIMPFKDDFNPIYEDHIVSVCKKLKYTCTRADLIDSPNVIINDIWSLIHNADIIICDCTQKNPNVFYELGLAHALGKKVICITQNADDVPFDIKQIRYIKYEYNPRGMKEFEIMLARYLREENRSI